MPKNDSELLKRGEVIQHKFSLFSSLFPKNVEFDFTANTAEDGSITLRVGHPVAIREDKISDISLDFYLEKLIEFYRVPEITLDVKAGGKFDKSLGLAPYIGDELQVQLAELVRVLKKYKNYFLDGKTKLTIGSVHADFLLEFHKALETNSELSGLKGVLGTELFTRFDDLKPFETAFYCGVSKVGLQLPPKDQLIPWLENMQKMHSNPTMNEGRGIVWSKIFPIDRIAFYLVDSPEIDQIIGESYFAGAEIISNYASEITESRRLREPNENKEIRQPFGLNLNLN